MAGAQDLWSSVYRVLQHWTVIDKKKGNPQDVRAAKRIKRKLGTADPALVDIYNAAFGSEAVWFSTKRDVRGIRGGSVALLGLGVQVLPSLDAVLIPCLHACVLQISCSSTKSGRRISSRGSRGCTPQVS